MDQAPQPDPAAIEPPQPGQPQFRPVEFDFVGAFICGKCRTTTNFEVVILGAPGKDAEGMLLISCVPCKVSVGTVADVPTSILMAKTNRMKEASQLPKKEADEILTRKVRVNLPVFN